MSDLRTLGKAMRDAQRAYEIGNMHDYLAMRAAEAAFDRALNDPRAALANVELIGQAEKAILSLVKRTATMKAMRDALEGVLGLAESYLNFMPDRHGHNIAKLEAAREAIAAFDAALSQPPAEQAGEYDTLRSANIARQAEWDAGNQLTLAYRGNELAGEVGEACNVIKKLERERMGIRGSRATVEQLAEELADVVICADLIAMAAGIDLDAAVAAKFNATSEKIGLTTRMKEPTCD